MDNLGVTEISVIGVVCLFVIKELFALIKTMQDRRSKETTGAGIEHWMKELAQDVSEIKGIVISAKKTTEKCHALHDVRDAEGIPVWYMKRSLEATISKLDATMNSTQIGLRDAIQSMSLNIKTQTETFKELVRELRNKG